MVQAQVEAGEPLHQKRQIFGVCVCSRDTAIASLAKATTTSTDSVLKVSTSVGAADGATCPASARGVRCGGSHRCREEVVLGREGTHARHDSLAVGRREEPPDGEEGEGVAEGIEPWK